MTKAIQTVTDYFESTISGLPFATNLVLTLDPDRFLKLNKEFIDTNGKKWQVIHYFGNDLTFRKEYSNKSKDQRAPIVIWITYPPERKEGKINLSYIFDIIQKTEKTIDLSLHDILDKVIHGETWPDELFKYTREIGNDLSHFKSLHQTLRKQLPQKAPLNINHAKALIIALKNSQIPIEELILGSITPEEGLNKYVALILSYDVDKNDTKLLREIVESNLPQVTSEIAPWLELNNQDLATFLYLLDIAKRYHIPNPIVQLKGIGLLSFDPDPLDHQRIAKVLENTNSQPDLRLCIMKIAEKRLGAKELSKLVDCMNLKTPTLIAEAIQKEKYPLFVYTLSIHFLKETTKTKELDSKDISWARTLDNHPIIAEKIETKFSQRATDILHFLAGVASILQAVEEPFEPKNDIASIIDWYKESGIFKVQLTIARINRSLKAIYDDELRKTLAEQLSKIRKHATRKLETADLNLASLIEKSWKEYLSHPRLAINVLHDYVLNREITPTKTRRIWILIFDGMRLDTWEEIVKPIMSSRFEVREEKLYITMLPSETDVARVAILAGASPIDWADYEGAYTSDHNILASRLFQLSRSEGKQKLRVTVSSETDYAQRRLDEAKFLYNVLIYNLSDDWIHSFRGDVCELNDNIRGTLERTILPDLERRISEEDHVILTSDHGFIELASENGIHVDTRRSYSRRPRTEEKPFVAHRRMKNLLHSSGYRIAFNDLEFFTVAKGRKWFSRPRGKYSRYAHGGISLDETVVPGALIGKIAIPRVDLSLRCPDSVQLSEDVSSKIDIELENKGNTETEFVLIIAVNTGEKEKYPGALLPKETQHFSFTFAKPNLRMKHLRIALSYRDADGKMTQPKTKIIPISVKERKDKVEFRFGGLDKLGE